MDMQYNENGAQSESALVNILINKHIVKTESQANIVLVAFIVIGFGITIYTIFFR